MRRFHTVANRTGASAWSVFMTILILLSLLVATGVVGAGYIYFKFARDLPDISALASYRPSLVTRVYDIRDELIAEYYVEKRILTPLEDVPQTLILATIAVEDSSFFEHHGINVEGIIRAMWANYQAGRVVQGGSSITQQVVKQLLLTSDRTMERKIKEAILSVQIDRSYSKNEILEIYLNQIYYGHGAYGVTAAAQTYFGKDLGDLTLAEMAMIAGLPKAPNNFSPYVSPARARDRRSHSLDRMANIGAITFAQQEEAYSADFNLVGRKKPTNLAPWFAEHVRRYLEKNYGAKDLYHGGLIVRTTLDLSLQKAADKAVRKGLEVTDRRLGYRGPLSHIDLALGEQPDWEELRPKQWGSDTTLDERYQPGTILKGLVLSVEKKAVHVGFEDAKGVIPIKEMKWAHEVNPAKNARWAAKVRDARKVLSPGDIIEARILPNPDATDGVLKLALEQYPAVQGALLAIDPKTGYILAMVGGYDASKSKFNRAIQARRQPGSSFKPIIYTAAMSKGVTPSTIILDSPIIFNRAVTEFKGWKPMNFEGKFFGPTTVREAVTHSRNVVTIKVLEKVGVKYTAEFARERFGFKSPLDENLSLALGASPVTLLEMVTAYSTLAARGMRPKPIFIRSVEDSDGFVLEENAPESQRVISESLAYIMTNIMTGVVREGTGRRVKQVITRPIAGKTGTTNNNIDAWFNGFTPDLVCGVWVGRDNNKPLGRLETGSRVAIPIWTDFMKVALADSPSYGFTPPADIVFVKIDRKSGLLTRAEGKGVIFESFIDGTQPTKFVPSVETPMEMLNSGGML